MMKVCKSCEQPKPPALFFEDGDWCHACVLATLDEQTREANNTRIRPQVFAT